MKLPATTERVTLHSAAWKTQKIEQEMERRLQYYVGHPEKIECRIKELDEEWDMERTLETNASALALTGLGLGVTLNRKWFLVSALVMGFLLQHALQGWCPPVPLFRRLGIRTQSEIEMERYALKALRGDFATIADQSAVLGNQDMTARVIDAVKK